MWEDTDPKAEYRLEQSVSTYQKSALRLFTGRSGNTTKFRSIKASYYERGSKHLLLARIDMLWPQAIKFCGERADAEIL